MKYRSYIQKVTFAGILALGIFAIDLSLPLGVAAGVLYVVLVMLGFWAERERDVVLLAIAGSVLNLLGYLVSEPAGVHWMVLSNRVLAFLVIWASAALVTIQMRNRRELAAASNELEQRIRERTAELDEREQRFQTLAANVDGGLLYLDTNYRYQFVNNTYANWFGLKPSDFIGRSPAEVLGAAIAEGTRGHLEAALSGEKVTYEAERGNNIDERRDVQVTNVPDIAEDGSVLGVFVLVTDVSVLKQRERALLDSQRSLAEAQRVGRIGHWRVVIGTGEIQWSDELYRIFGVDPESFTPTPESLVGLTHPDDMEQMNRLRQDTPNDESAYHLEYRIIRPDGAVRVISGEGHPEFDADGEFVSVFGIAQDVTEAKQVEISLAERNRLLQSTIENWPGSVSLRGRDGRYVFVSQHVADILGVAVEDLIGKTLSEAVGEVESTGIDDLVSQVLSNGEPILNLEREAARAPGRWFLTNIQPLLDSDGKVEFVLSTSMEVTARRQSEDALRASEERFRDFANAASDWFWEMGPDLTFTFHSERYYELTGFQPEDKIGTTRTQYVDPGALVEEEGKWNEHFATLKAGKPFRNFEFAFQVRDGSTRHARISGTPIFDAEGTFAGYRGTGSDITQQKLAEQSSLQLVAALDTLPLAIHLWDQNGRLIVTNETQREWFPEHGDTMKPGAHISEHIRYNVEHGLVDVAPGEEEAYIAQRVNNFLNPPPNMFEQQLVAGRWLQVTNKRLPNGIIVGIRLDITETKLREEQLIQAQKMEAVGQLTGGIAHDFNNLLAITLGNLELLLEAAEPRSRISDLATSALDATRRGADLTQRLLAFSRRQPLQPDPFDANQLVEGMHDLLVRTLGEDIAIELYLTRDPWLCMADPGQLESTILNLCINARDAMPRGGRLIIRTANTTVSEDEATDREDLTPGEYVSLAITDTGKGMSPEVVAQAFDPFFTTKEVGKGSGLGLSMIYGFVKQSGGHVRMESRPGVGTTVSIFLPRS